MLLIHRGEGVPSARIRMLEMAPRLAEEGAEVDCAPYPASTADWTALLERAAGADVAVLQKKLPSLRDAKKWRALPPIVFDFDDALPWHAHPEGRGHRSRTRSRRFRRACGLARAFTAGNQFLAELCPRGKPVLVAPSAVRLPAIAEKSCTDGAPRIGWIGGSGNFDALRLLAEPFARLAKRRPFRLVVISDADFDLAGCEVENERWSLDSEERALARLDVGVMPLADTPWSRGKCAYKLLQYMAAGVPCVASPVGMNVDLVEDGHNGLLADGAEEWEDRLDRLLGDAALRDRLGRAGRETVEADYTYPAQARRWMPFLREVAACSTP